MSIRHSLIIGGVVVGFILVNHKCFFYSVDMGGDKVKKTVQPNARSACALANGLDILGDRWTLLIIRDLMFTNRNEFGHMLNAGEGISTNILTERLERLQCYGVIEKNPHPTHGKKFVYQLTDKGTDLAPLLIEFSLWAKKSIAETFIPPSLYRDMVDDRAGLIKKIKSRTPLIVLDL